MKRAAEASIVVLLLAAVVLMAAAPAPARAERLRGIDVSRFQGRINWDAVATDDVNFAFLQASRGSGGDCTVAAERCGADEFYDRNYQRAREAGIPVGPYHRTFTGGVGPKGVRADARKEAKVFIAEVGALAPGDLRPVLDFESPFGDLDEADLRRWARTWLTRVEFALGAKPLIYTNVSSWRAIGDTTRFAALGYPLWVANFDVAKPLVPALNWIGLGWSIWQYTSSGQVEGIAGNVDLDTVRVPLETLTVGG